MGSCGPDIPFETRFLIVEGQNGCHFREGSEDGAGLCMSFFYQFLKGTLELFFKEMNIMSWRPVWKELKMLFVYSKEMNHEET